MVSSLEPAVESPANFDVSYSESVHRPHPRMTSTRVNRPSTMRWMVAIAILVVYLALVTATTGAAAASVAHTLTMMALALIVYAWGIYPTTGNILLSTVTLLCVAWVWAVRKTVALGLDLVVGMILLSVVVWHRRQRTRYLHRLQQLVDDLHDQRVAKEQLVLAASQAREALQKKLARYTHLQSIGEELSNMTDLVVISRLAVNRAFELIGKSDVCLLYLVDKEQQELSLFASKKRESLPSIRAKHGDQFDRHVLRTHRPLLVNDVRRDFRFTVTMSPERPISSVIACPLLLGQSPEGVLRLDSAHPAVYTQDDLRLLDILLDLVASAVTNAKLFAQTQQLAVTDGLTGLTLRRPFLEQLTRELTRSTRSREPVSVLMLDVDHFKTYNDTYGHMAGDLILKAVADVLRTVVPPGGVIARYGGEEFAVLLPRLPRPQASEVAEHIRRLVEERGQGSGRPAPPSAGKNQRSASLVLKGNGVTISIGVAACPDDAQVELELIRIADHRLYQAKHVGRNMVCAS